MSSQPLKPVRMGVVGIGNFGRLHARTLTGLAEADLVAIVDRDEAALAEVRQQLPGDVPRWIDLNDALREGDAEAWVIATRTDSHIPLAEQILSAGKPVLIEKPLAENVAEARRLEPLVASDSRNLMLGHLLLFASEFRQLLQEVRRRGPLVYFHAFRHRPINTAEIYPEETPFRLLMVHDLYLAFALMDGAEPHRIAGRLRPRSEGGFDTSTGRLPDRQANTNLGLAELEWEGGTWGSFTASYLTPPGMGADGFDRLEVFGQGWAAQLRLNPQPLEIWAEQAEWPLTLDIYADPAAPSGWLAEELRHFCRVVRGQAEVPLGARYADAVRIQNWLEQLESSAS